MTPIAKAMEVALRRAGFPVPTELDIERLLHELKGIGMSLSLPFRQRLDAALNGASE